MGFTARLTKLLDQWGRYVFRNYWSWQGLPSQQNPDDTTSDEYFDIANCPQIIAGKIHSDVSHLFVSAKGLEEEKTGASFPAQLIWTSPEFASQEIFDFVAQQLDEELDSFAEVIRSTDDAAKDYGFNVLEYEWYRKDTQPFQGKAFVKQVYTRDPEPYRFDIDGVPGIYKNNGFGIYERVLDNKFQSYAYTPLFNNPYGTSINFPLKPWVQTWNKVFGYWRHALELAGLGFLSASYPNTWSHNDMTGKELLAKLKEAMEAVKAGTYVMFPEGANVQNLKFEMEAQAFLDWYTAFCEIVSLIYTGTTGALKEEQFGSRAAKESTDVRSRSVIEQFNALRICNFWSYQFIPMLVDMNFPPEQVKAYPALQLIKPELIAPITPKDQVVMDEENPEDQNPEDQNPQDEQEKITIKTKQEEQDQKQKPPVEFAEGEIAPKVIVPVAIPAKYVEFPNTDPLPEPYKDAMGYAHDALDLIEAKEYNDVQPGEVSQVFTIKRLRNYTVEVLPILRELKTGIDLTLEEPNEAEAWSRYYRLAVAIFQASSINIDTAIRDDLKASFRQARQNAFGGGQILQAQADPSIVGLRIMNRPSHDHHPIHPRWDGIVIPKDHKELQVGGRLRIPMDFGCICYYEPVRNMADLTNEQSWPTVYPGETYKYYAQPIERQPEIQ